MFWQNRSQQSLHPRLLLPSLPVFLPLGPSSGFRVRAGPCGVWLTSAVMLQQQSLYSWLLSSSVRLQNTSARTTSGNTVMDMIAASSSISLLEHTGIFKRQKVMKCDLDTMRTSCGGLIDERHTVPVSWCVSAVYYIHIVLLMCL